MVTFPTYTVRFYRRLTGEKGIVKQGMTEDQAKELAAEIQATRPIATDIFVERESDGTSYRW